ncbi:MAG TPA: FAD:protein FMN transferase [Clostridia bacterium]|nr:FAD:protein FMN transferase [Clostridia bacterium]
MKKYLCILLIISFLLAGCTKQEEYETSFFAFDTIVEFKLYEGGNQEILDELKKEALRIEKLLNIHDETSVISSLKGNSLEENEISELIKLSNEMKELTQGAFDPYLGRVSALWAFGTEEENIPLKEDLDKYIALKIGESLEDLDLGSIAKGYAANQLQELAKKAGVESALFNLGGNIITLGNYQEGTYNIGIQDPLDQTGEIFGFVKMGENSAVTSGAYQRGFEEEGVWYHHILDPKTGYPVDNDLLSVSLVLEDSARADAYSTALFVMGFDKAKEYAHLHSLPVILVRKDGAICLLNAEKFTFVLLKEEYFLLQE